MVSINKANNKTGIHQEVFPPLDNEKPAIIALVLRRIVIRRRNIEKEAGLRKAREVHATSACTHLEAKESQCDI